MIYGSVSTGSHIEKTVFDYELGWECAFVSEIDKYANQVIRFHDPDTPNLGDFSKIEANERTTRIQLLTGGTPCQAFSVAGLRKGFADSRGNLTLEFLALADRLKPTWILWENVPGVLSQDGGRAFGAFLGGLGELGYGFAYRVLDAQYFGVPQRRRRVFVVGHLGDWRRAAAVLFERHSLQGHPPPSREAGSRLAPTATGGPPFSRTGNSRVEAEAMVAAPLTTSAHADNESQESRLVPETFRMTAFGEYADDDHASAIKARDGKDATDLVVQPYQCQGSNVGPMGALRAGNGNESGGVPFVAQGVSLRGREGGGTAELSGDVATALRSSGGGGDKPYVCVTGDRTHALKAEGADASEDGTGRGTPIVAFNGRQDPCPSDYHTGALDEDGLSQCIAFSSKDHGADAGDLSPTLRSMNNAESNVNGGGQVAVAFQSKQSASAQGPSFDDVSPSLDVAKAGGMAASVGMRVRRLMPVECERLQGWPDGWTQYGRTKAGEIVEISDTQRYKIIGNGWALPVVRWIAHRIEWINGI